MPKYTVSVTETVKTYYASVEIEAPSEDDAIARAEEMALNGHLDEGRGRSTWSSHAALIGEPA